MAPSKNIVVFSAFLIIIIYWVGILGLVTHNIAILKLTPINMLVSLVLLNFGYNPSTQLYAAQLGVLLFGYGIEVLGVHVDMVFGTYSYMDNLGIKILETPLVMGVNWVITVFCAAGMVSSLKLENKLLSALLASLLMVCMDLWIEPVSENAGFWFWKLGTAPLRNYIAWFVIGLGLQFFLFRAQISLNNSLSFLLYALQLVFFIFANTYI